MTMESNASKIERLENELKTRRELRRELRAKTRKADRLLNLLSEAEAHNDVSREGDITNEIGVVLAELRGITVQINALFACQWQNPGYVPKEDDEELYGSISHPDFSKLQKLQKLRNSSNENSFVVNGTVSPIDSNWPKARKIAVVIENEIVYGIYDGERYAVNGHVSTQMLFFDTPDGLRFEFSLSELESKS